LRKGYLASLHFSIYEDRNRPLDILEAWVFKFVYHENPHTGARVASSIEVTNGSQSGVNLTVNQAKQSLIDFIQKLTTMSATLPSLPSSRYMTVEMIYTDNCPQGYRAPNFDKQTPDTTQFPQHEDWMRTSQPVAAMSAGHHAVALTVVHLKKNDGNVPNTIPPGIDFRDRVTKKDLTDAALIPSLSMSQTSYNASNDSDRKPARSSRLLPDSAQAKNSTAKKSRKSTSSMQNASKDRGTPPVLPDAMRLSVSNRSSSTVDDAVMQPVPSSTADLHAKEQYSRMVVATSPFTWTT
jgi:hypothetical protein